MSNDTKTCTSASSKKDIERGEESSAKFPKFQEILRFAKMIACAGISGAAAAIAWYYFGWLGVAQVAALLLIAFLITGRRWRWLYVAARTGPRDLRALLKFLQTMLKVRKKQPLTEMFLENVQKHPDKVMFVFEDTHWTFKEVDDYSNQVANLFKEHGYRKGDSVALFLENRPEFVCLWLGLAKLGVIVPLINYNLRDQSLIHSFSVGNCKAIIFGSELSEAMEKIKDNLSNSIVLYRWTDKASNQNSSSLGKNLTQLIAESSTTPPVITETLTCTDRLLYIYTSGTTGLPKAAVITSARFVFMASALHYLTGITLTDRIYTPLPLYHTAGGCVGIGQAIIFGCSVAIKRKFSASAYFPDCKKYECTISQYIGEICRYVLSTPPKPEDKEHKVRAILGNGLRPQIWKEFVSRFNIQHVAEFYGATEGNANIVNTDNTVGAIGFVSRIIPSFYPISIVKADPATGLPIRDSRGLCQVCEPDEPGVFVGKIIENDPSRQFLGYVDESASEKKIVKDVFKKGDAAFLSGDIVVSDELGYLYFRDRTGDTFRWKGENVSTTEVEAVVSNITNYADCVVYGVEIDNQDGRVGMAAILDDRNTLNLANLAEGLKEALPSYARPQIIRRLEKLDVTGTFKLRKVDLQKEGFDPKVVRDRLYYWSNGSFVDLTQEDYSNIQAGKIKF